MSKREEDLAGRIVHQLDQGLAEIDQRALARLRLARQTAAERIQLQPAWGFAWAGIPNARSGLRYFNPRYVLPLVALLFAVSGALYWQQTQHIDDPADIDAKLLSGELPIDAYLDKGLDSWLKR